MAKDHGDGTSLNWNNLNVAKKRKISCFYLLCRDSIVQLNQAVKKHKRTIHFLPEPLSENCSCLEVNVKKPDFILFDCMETLIDVVEKPDLRLYAKWCYDGCGHETLWENFDGFLEDYRETRDAMKAAVERNRELDYLDILRSIFRKKFPSNQQADQAARQTLQNYWQNYRKNCYVDDGVKTTLKELSCKYPLGVVSNFMVDGGIEELLEIHGLIQCFRFVITSVREGWKKPHSRIHDAAAALSRVPADKTLFVGDDYECDYIGPRQYGFHPVLLDKQNRYPNVQERISAVPDLLKMLE